MMVVGDDQDLHATYQENDALVLDDMLTGYDVNNGFFSMDEDDKITDGSVNDFYNEEFPLLPDFPCMSSSSSSTQPPSIKPAILSVSSSSTSSAATSSSSATSSSVLRSDSEETPAAAAELLPPPPSSAAVDCMDVMENFGYMDLLDANDLWDPSSIFGESSVENKIQSLQNREKEDEEEERQLDELGAMFFEWLKNNKEHISAQDMRSIKLKKSTVESASKRLGSSNEGKKQLLKLILEWVENYQLQKKNNGETLPSQFPFHTNPNPNPCFPPPPSWIPQTFDPISGNGFHMGDSFSGITNFQNYPPAPPPPVEYHHQMMDNSNSNSLLASQFMMSYNQFPYNIVAPDSMNPSSVAIYGNQYRPQVIGNNGTDRLLRLGSSATKEARKKRMARQRRVNSSHHHSRHHHSSSNGGCGGSNNNNHEQNERNIRLSGEVSNKGTWVYVPCGSAPPPGGSTVRLMPPGLAAGGGSGSVPAAAAKRAVVQSKNYRRQAATDRRQGCKQEKNLKFLLQKVLKQSDVGNLGRIVLPKKEAETHLPALDTRDGIAISMEDIGSLRVWSMRYRFWPNNKSRMYLLENTGEFVRENGLQEGDFIVIYSDVKCGKYLIRGVKVHQPGPKPEGKKTEKRNLQRNSIPYESSSSLTKRSFQ